MERLRVAAICFVALAILIGFPGRSLSASAPAGLDESAARVETVSIFVGDRALNATPRHRAYDPRTGWTIDRGAVVERFVPRTDGVEQTWTFAERPAGEGDLVVRVAVPGAEFVGADASGLAFREARTGANWTYGHGTWIGADGQRTAVPARWTDGAIELRVPVEVVARSIFPAVLDPVVSEEFELGEPITGLPTAGDQSLTDIWWNGNNWSVRWASGNEDIAVRVSSDGTLFDEYGVTVEGQGVRATDGTNRLYVEADGDYTLIATLVDSADNTVQTSSFGSDLLFYKPENPRVAYGNGIYVVVWDAYNSMGGPGSTTYIQARRFDVHGNPLDPENITVYSGTDFADCPSVAFGNGVFSIVWNQHDYDTSGWFPVPLPDDVLAVRIAPDGAVLDASPLVVSSDDADAQCPEVAFNSSHFVAVWGTNTGTAADLSGRRIGSDGALPDAGPFVVSAASGAQLDPRIVPTGSQCLVAWVDQRNSATNGSDIYGTRIDPSGSVLDIDGIPISTAAGDQVLTSIAYGDSGFFLTWNDERNSALNATDVFGGLVGESGTVLHPLGIPISTESGDQYDSVVSWSGSQYLVGWSDDRDSTTDVYAQRIDSSGAPDGGEILLTRAVNSQTWPDLAFGDDLWFVTWVDGRDPSKSLVYGMRINRQGDLLDHDGVVVVDNNAAQGYPSVDFAGSEWLVAMEESDGVVAGRFDPSAGALDGTGIAISSDGERPIVCGGDDRWLVLWQQDTGGFNIGVWALRGVVIGGDGNPIGTEFEVLPDASPKPSHRRDVDCVYGDGEWFVVWNQEFAVTFPNWYEIVGQRIDVSGNTLGDALILWEGTLNLDGGQPAIAFGDGTYMVTWDSDNGQIATIADTVEISHLSDSSFRSLVLEYDGQLFAGRTFSAQRWFQTSGISLGSTEIGPWMGDFRSDGVRQEAVAYVEMHETSRAGRVKMRLLDHVLVSRKADALADGNVDVTWQVNPAITDAQSVNVYRSLSFDEGFEKVNTTPLPLDSATVDVETRPGISNFYSIELVRSGGGTVSDARDKLWALPPAPERTFLLSVRETTVASVPGDTSTYDVEVQSQKGYDGAVALDVIGLPAEAVSATFDPATIDVPGHSTLTVQWDPMLAPPAGGYAYPFQISATEVGSAAAVIKTVDVLGVVIDGDDHYLTQFVYPAEPEAGHKAEVFGRLTPHEAGQTVTVTTGTSLDVYTVTTDDTGYFSLAVPVSAAGTIQFVANAAGTSAAPYVTAAKRGRRRARMTAVTGDGTIDPGDLVEIDGRIEPSAGVGTVRLEIENPDETIAFSGDVTVDEYGTFHQSFFAQEGVTAVEAEVGDNADFYNASARLNVPVHAPIGMAVVVAAGGEKGNPSWPITGELCDFAYNTYRGRLIPENRVRYLHPDTARDPDGDGTPEIAATVTKANVQAAIETWASGLVDVSTTAAPFKTPLTLYIVGLEVSPGVVRLNETETLSSTELDSWLDQFLVNVQSRYEDPCDPEIGIPCPPDSVPVNVVLEFRRSGVFLADLSGPNRIIVTSTGDHGIVYPPAESPPYPGLTNRVDLGLPLSFSGEFFNQIDLGSYIATAWVQGWWQMASLTVFDQNPLIDANGNGIPNEDADRIQGDGAGDKVLEYRNTYKRRPVIDLTFSGLTIPEGRSDGVLWAHVLEVDESVIDRVKCVILPPAGSGEPIREYRMQWNASENRFELHHDGFRHRGFYKIVITAIDEDEDAALPWASLVDVRGDTLGEDTTPPDEVTDVYTRAEDGQVYLSWTESVSSDVAGYYVYTKPAGGSYGTGVYAGNADHYTVTGLTNGASYLFKITAIDEVPNESDGVETGVVTPRGAEFAADAMEILPNTTVQFADLSTGSPTGWSWDLDGDAIEDSTAQNPSFLYTNLGTYTVTLTATYADGSDQETKANYISVQSQVADFSATPTHGTLPMSVQFTDESISESTITAWSWDLDGDAVEDSADQHPSHQYDAPGEYDVTLTVTTAGGSDSETKEGYIVVSCPTPDPSFTGIPQTGPAPLDVTFTSTTEAPATGCDPTAWDWTFGDSGTGSGEVVAHTYTEDGLYDVCLTVTVPGTSAQTCVVDYIDVGGGCASGNLCLTLLLAGYWDGTEQSTEAYLTIDFYADPDAVPSYRITGVQLDIDGTAIIDLTAAGVVPGAYYVVARPLNHLDLMSESMLTVAGAAAAGLDADFTDPAQVACGEAALVFAGERWCAPGGDASGDGQVDLSDYSLLAQQWGLAGPEADFTGDAVVDLSDYSNLAQYWTRQMCVDVPALE